MIIKALMFKVEMSEEDWDINVCDILAKTIDLISEYLCKKKMPARLMSGFVRMDEDDQDYYEEKMDSQSKSEKILTYKVEMSKEDWEKYNVCDILAETMDIIIDYFNKAELPSARLMSGNIGSDEEED